MTNKEYLLSSDRVLAEKLVYMVSEPDYDYDYEDRIYECGTLYSWVCPDGTTFGEYCTDEQNYEDAVQYTMEWLGKEYVTNKEFDNNEYF